ncbi:VIR protein [Plasmodium vivax]|uniref:VIR protein n=1 Tax=Plasmodium vivax TaxID=5855 RepID=A0A1G4E9E2_PLAVI|nr:VIR protein [Plasmodium vivax]
MAECQSGSAEYLNHACYTYLNDKFKNTTIGESSKEYFDKVYDIFKGKDSRHFLYHPLLLELITYTSDDGVFILADKSIACNFLNYLLNDKLRNTGYQYNNISHYDIYKKFVKDFYIERHGKLHQDKSCSVYIKDIEDAIFKRMATLYQLYDDYNDLKKNNKKFESKECDKLGKFASFFNEIARTHGKNDDELLKKLKDLKNLIEGKISSFYDTCNTKISFFHLPEPSSQDQKITAPALSQANVHPDPALTSHGAQQNLQETSILRENSPEKREKEVREDLYTSSSSDHSEELTSINASHHSPGSVSLSTWESEDSPRIPESDTRHVSGSFHRLGRSHAQIPEEPDLLMKEGRGNIEGETYQPDYRPSNLGAKEGGVSGILSSIGGVLGEVDPAPVLGVSGGMGVLFILFKLDPSLEEEEDDSVKFLEVLEDFQQISQIFMNMKVGILDMEQ